MQPRVNGRIKASEVKLLDENEADLGLFSLSNALTLAQSQEKDLVEIDPKCSPPVCQVIDYGKYRYRIRARGNRGKL